MLCAYMVLKPARSSLIITHMGAGALPLMFLLTAVAISLIVFLYNRLFLRFERHVLLSASAVFFMANLVIFWGLFHLGRPWVSVAFYVWVACFSVIIANQFWSFTHDLNDPRQGKRLYGFIACGGQIGAAAAGFASQRLAPWVGTEGLLLISAALLAPIAVIVPLQHRLARERIARREDEAPTVPEDSGQSGLALVLGSPLMRIVASLVLGLMIAGAVIDYQFGRILELQGMGKDRLTAFFGWAYGLTSLLSFLINLLLTSFVQRRFGIQAALMLLPVIALSGAFGFCLAPSLAAISFLEIGFRSLEYSINHATREVLYLSLAREVKYKAKACIDMVFYRVGDAVGALFILLCTYALRLPLAQFRWLNILLLAGYALLVLSVRRRYVSCLRANLLSMGAAEGLPSPAALPPADWESRLGERLQAYVRCLATALEKPSGPEHESASREAEALSSEIFFLLGAVAPPEDLRLGQSWLHHPRQADARLGFEFLDNILPYRWRRRVLSLFNREIPLARRVKMGRRQWGV